MTTLWNAVTLTAWALLRKLEAPLCTPLKEKKAAAAAVMRRAYHCCNLLEASLCNLATAAGQPQMRALDAQVGLAFMSKVCRQQKCLSCILCSYCARLHTLTLSQSLLAQTVVLLHVRGGTVGSCGEDI